ncbi:MAG: GNAT family N-acetyltransferase [Candidatus Dojkabacteria bacterium]|nr:GNAT family N-acetyltransferase [Candidatus Dojkabacteria bacterium]
MEIQPLTEKEVIDAQVLRKQGWQDNYVNPETGVTQEILVTELASLPVPQKDIDYNLETISKPENKDNNLVAIQDGEVAGVVFYEQLENGNGDIGVFVKRGHRGQGIGTRLLQELIARTDNSLEVTIFARNRSRALYKKLGFKEVGDEGKHVFRVGVSLPIQRLVLVR